MGRACAPVATKFPKVMAFIERHVLVVCTANVCRSPVAERLLQREWTGAGVPVQVTSAGSRGGRNTVHPATLEAARFVRVDLSDHTSRLLTADMIDTEGADLVIGMTREHLRHAISLQPTCWPRAFTFRELVRRTAQLASSPASWEDWLAVCHDGRNLSDLIVPLPTDDLPDPYGRPLSDHIMMVQEVAGASALLAASTPGS